MFINLLMSGTDMVSGRYEPFFKLTFSITIWYSLLSKLNQSIYWCIDEIFLIFELSDLSLSSEVMNSSIRSLFIILSPVNFKNWVISDSYALIVFADSPFLNFKKFVNSRTKSLLLLFDCFWDYVFWFYWYVFNWSEYKFFE